MSKSSKELSQRLFFIREEGEEFYEHTVFLVLFAPK